MLKECGLAAVAQRYLHIALDKALQTSDWTGTLTPAQLCYAARDAHVTLQLVPSSKRPWGRGARAGGGYRVSCVPALAWLSLAGVPLDAQRWRDRANLRGLRPKRSKPSSAPSAQSRNGSGHLFPEAMNWQSPQQCSTSCSTAGMPSPHGL